MAFGGLLSVVLYLINAGENVTEILPLLRLYAFAFQRLTPQLQEVFNSPSSLRFYKPVLDQLLKDLSRTQVSDGQADENAGSLGNIRFEGTLALHGITFKYPNAVTPTLNGIDLTIREGTFIDISGSTGGKTTLVDILLAYLRQQMVN